MHEKKRTIIESAMKLFAQNGYYATSIQEIADHSGISKGAVYQHFRSKEELMFSIFRHYFEKIRERMEEVDKARLSPRERLLQKVHVLFEEVAEHKEFIIMQFREQAISRNRDLDRLLANMRYEAHRWQKNSLLEIYGESIRPYLSDAVTLLDGIQKSYLHIMILDEVQLDLTRLSSFIVNRLDDVVKGMLASGDPPVIPPGTLGRHSALLRETAGEVRREVLGHLKAIRQIIHNSDLDDERKAEMHETAMCIQREVESDQPKMFLIQGLLANFKELESLDTHREAIAELLNIKLL